MSFSFDPSRGTELGFNAAPTKRDCAAAFPSPSSSTGRKYYAFARRHDLGPLVCCGWTLSERIWHLSGYAMAPKGFADLEQACQYSFDEFGSYAAEIRHE